MAAPGNTGIYEIVNLVSGKCYIGSAANFAKRWYSHRWRLNRNSHHSFVLQRAWLKHGADAFEFRVIEICETSELIVREQFHLDGRRPVYNVAKHAGGGGGPMTAAGKLRVAEANKRRIGFKMSAESRARISAAKLGNASTKGQKRARAAVERTAATHRGRKRSAETRARIAEAMIGSKKPPRSLEYRLKLSAALKGRKKSREHMLALQEGRRKRIYTEEQRSKIAANLSAQYVAGTRKRERSPEYRAKISATLRGRKLTPEHRANVAAAMRGKTRGPYNVAK